MKTHLKLIAATFLALAPIQMAQAQTPECPDPATATDDVEQTIRDFFTALRGEGDMSVYDLTTNSMYSYDVGERFERGALAGVIIEALKDGVEINWNLGPMDIKVRCDVAWSAWENVGSAGTPPNIRPAGWLESAVLVHQDGRWKIDFFHSQRARLPSED
ncbi:MAG: hypothetical protein AAF251_15250 [Pseudomonadota bacterium]